MNIILRVVSYKEERRKKPNAKLNISLVPRVDIL
jgi:hypothetical protein